MSRNSRQRGRVKWFKSDKGYGFIERDGEPDVFVHWSAIIGDGYRTLMEGQLVEFSIVQSPKGLAGSEVTILEAPE